MLGLLKRRQGSIAPYPEAAAPPRSTSNAPDAPVTKDPPSWNPIFLPGPSINTLAEGLLKGLEMLGDQKRNEMFHIKTDNGNVIYTPRIKLGSIGRKLRERGLTKIVIMPGNILQIEYNDERVFPQSTDTEDKNECILALYYDIFMHLIEHVNDEMVTDPVKNQFERIMRKKPQCIPKVDAFANVDKYIAAYKGSGLLQYEFYSDSTLNTFINRYNENQVIVIIDTQGNNTVNVVYIRNGEGFPDLPKELKEELGIENSMIIYSFQQGGSKKVTYNGRKYTVRMGKRGGLYILVGKDKKKVYLRK